MAQPNLADHVYDLIERASTRMPPDVARALAKQRDKEIQGSRSQRILDAILENIELAKNNATPICQDTGTNVYYVDAPESFKASDVEKAIVAATKKATAASLLRPNAVDCITGKNTGNGVGAELPIIHYRTWSRSNMRIQLLLKGGGAEDVSAQYKLPDVDLQAGRDMKGVARAVMDAVQKAQGLGCAPGIIGVGIGGDRETSHRLAKEQLLRKLDDKNKDKKLAQLERTLPKALNKLGIGPMGFGGRTTVLAVKAGAQHRHPNNYYVSIAYGCWAVRRATLSVQKKGRSLSGRVSS